MTEGNTRPIDGRRLILIGGGGHARVVADAVRSMGESYEMMGFVDVRNDPALAASLRLPLLGDDAVLASYATAWGILAVGAINDLERRRAIVARLDGKLAGWAYVKHEHAYVSPDAYVDEGSVVMAGAVVQCGARIGRHCVVNSGAIVEHDVVLDDFVQVGPGAAIGGGVSVGTGTYIGLGAAIRDHIRIGSHAIIGMGAVVVKHVNDAVMVRGVPAR